MIYPKMVRFSCVVVSAIFLIAQVCFSQTNIAVDKPYMVSSFDTSGIGVDGQGFAGYLANDGDMGTRWNSDYHHDPKPDSGWFYMDLQAQHVINSVKIYWETAGGLHYAIQVAHIPDPLTQANFTQLASDGAWTTVADITNGVSGETRTITFPPTAANEVRVRGYSRTTVYGYSIWEIQCFDAPLSAPVISTQPLSQTKNAGQSVAFTVVAVGNPIPTYQWKKNGTNISGATNATYTIAAVAASDAATYAVAVTNSQGTVTSSGAVLTVKTAPSNLTYRHNPVSYTAGTAITPDSAVVTGTVDSFAVSPPLPAGLTLAKPTGIITGTPTAVTAATNFTVTARNSVGTTTVVLSITVVAAPVAPSNLSYKQMSLICVVGTAIKPDTATVTGTVDSFTVSPALPAGLAIVKATGLISGTPTAVAALASYTVTARNVTGSTTVPLTITVSAAVVAPTNLSYRQSSIIVLVGTPIAADTALVTGTVDSFTVSPALPVGLNIAKTSGVISGTPTAVMATASYTVTARNSAGSVSAAVAITVNAATKALFGVSAATGKIPLAVTFTDSSSGTVSKRYWYFGDNTAVDSSLSPIHTYQKEGIFFAKLVVLDGSGKRADSITVAIRTYNENPILISGRLVPPDKVEITYSNYAYLPWTGAPGTLYADSVAMWYHATSIPLSGVGSTEAKSFTSTSLRTLDTLRIPQPFTDTIYGFVTVVHWSDGTWSKFAAGNGCLVLVKDTSQPANVCGVNGKYLGRDSAAVVITNLKLVDPALVDSFGLWYGTSPSDSTPDFTNMAATRWFSMSDQAAVIAATGKDSVVLVNSQFNSGAVKKVWCAVILKSKYDRSSPIVKSSFSVGVDRPLNPMALTAHAVAASRISLSWRAISGVDGIRIVYRANTPVPLNEYYFDTSQYMAFTPPVVTDTGFMVTGLNQMTHYYFGAQVSKAGLWSTVTQASSANDSTPQFGQMLDTNRVKLDSLTFDASTDQIRAWWKVTAVAGQDSLQVGISYSVSGYPGPADNGLVQQVVPVTIGKEMMAAVKLHENLLFNTKYYVALWENRVDGAWTPPTDSSLGTVTTPNYNWQSVTYFTRAGGDSAYAFNNNIRIMTDSVSDGEVVHATGTVVFCQPDASLFPGFIPASIAFKFSSHEQTARVYMGLKYNALPAGYSAADLRVYRLRGGVWSPDSNALLDAAGGYVSVKTNDLDSTFMVLLDTQAVTVVPNAYSAILPELSDVYDTFTVSDNAGNVKWQFMYAMGRDNYSSTVTTSGTLGQQATSGKVYSHIPYVYVTSDNGVRARLVATDGVHTTVADVSRQVRRLNSDAMRTIPMKWVPIRVTAKLDNAQVNHALQDSSVGSKAWTYDPTNVRLFRWYPSPTNATSNCKWVEYSDANADLFTFQSGGLLWIKTREETGLNFGSGVTWPLNSCYPIALAANNNFTDFALPFKFNVKVGDILDSTRTGTLNADSLQIFSWDRDSGSGVFSSHPVFMADWNGIAFVDRSASIRCLDLTGYTVRNPTGDQITLRVPPIPESMSKYGQAVSKAKQGHGWAIRLRAGPSKGSRQSEVYCGYDPDKGSTMRYYPLSPSFAQAYAGVYDGENRKVYGYALTGGIADGGLAYRIAFVNESQTAQRLMYACDAVGATPSDVHAKVFDDASGRFEGDGATVDLAAGETQLRWLFAGNDKFLAKAAVMNTRALRLIGTYPNPFRSAVRIRYTVPVQGVSSVTFTICDCRGAIVWRRSVGGQGSGDLIWNGLTLHGSPVAAGMYILRMRALDQQHRECGVFEKRMTLLP
jgi:PKD repeat protein